MIESSNHSKRLALEINAIRKPIYQLKFIDKNISSRVFLSQTLSVKSFILFRFTNIVQIYFIYLFFTEYLIILVF